MSCIYKYKGKKYSEEQFKEYFINNKQEFATSIAKNKDVIDSFKRKMEGIDFVFSQSPELESIGTKVQYLQYLSTIFPNSKVKDIVYHGSPSKHDIFKTIDEKAREEMFKHTGAMFTSDKNYTQAFGKNLYSVVLNIKNPVTLSDSTGINSTFVATQYYSKWKNENKDGVIGHDALLDLEHISEGTEYVVFESEQIHVLSSKADIQGFKDFVQGKQFQKLTAEEKAKTIEQVTKEHRSIVALKDLAHKLAYRIGGKVEFVNKTDVDWKGYNQGITSVFNEAYMDESTAFHEIAFHPIIRALKFMSSQKESVTLQQMVNNQEIEKRCG